MKRQTLWAALAIAIVAPAQARVIERITPLGTWVELAPGIRVEPLRVIEDSRCPADVDCVWAGQVVISARINDHGRRRTVRLVLREPAKVGRGRLTLDQVLPEKRAGVIPAREYRFGFSYVPVPPPPGEMQPL